MLRIRTVTEIIPVRVAVRSHYSVKHRKLFLKNKNSSGAVDNFVNQLFQEKKKLVMNHVNFCSVGVDAIKNECKDISAPNKFKCKQRACGSQSIVSVEMILKKLLECRTQRVGSWLIESELKLFCESYKSLSDLLKNQFLQQVAELDVAQQLWLFIQIGKLENGIRFIIYLRGDLLSAIGKNKDESRCQKLHELNTTLRDLSSMWFSCESMELKRITLASSRGMLEKIIKYERVHPIKNWMDLKRRMGPYRRCFVFLHHSIPGEPLIILHVALTNEISSSLTDILPRDVDSPPSNEARDEKGISDSEDLTRISTAMFYSLSRAQKGLNGIDIGYHIIKRVSRELKMEFPQINQFSSLSPIHHFKYWLMHRVERIKSGQNDILFPEEIKKFKQYFRSSNYLEQLTKLLSSNAWIMQENLCDLLKVPLMRSCARYLYLEKTPRGRAIDIAANLHLNNGAVMWRINWRANPYASGLGSSFGMMVNYRYYLEGMEERGRKYQVEGKISASEEITELIKSAQELMSNQSMQSKL